MSTLSILYNGTGTFTKRFSSDDYNTPISFSISGLPAGAQITSCVVSGEVTAADPGCNFMYISYKGTRIYQASSFHPDHEAFSYTTENILLTDTSISFVLASGPRYKGAAYNLTISNLKYTITYASESSGNISSTTFVPGSSNTFNIVPASPAYKHKIILSFGTGMSKTVSVNANVLTANVSAEWSWLNNIPNATSKTGGTLTLETYSGSTLVGTKTISTSCRLIVPDSVVPTFTKSNPAIQRTISRTTPAKTYANVGNYYVQGHCGVTAKMTSIAGAYGSTIVSCSISIAGSKKTGYYVSGGTVNSLTLNSYELNNSGSIPITYTATDSRGRTTVKNDTITVTAYSKPAVTLFNVFRTDASDNADDFGKYGRFEQATAYTAVGTNSKTVTMTCQGTTATNPAASGRLMPGSGNRKEFNILNTYNVTLTVSDAFETVTVTANINGAGFLMHFRANGKGVAFGKTATATPKSGYDKTFEVSDDMDIVSTTASITMLESGVTFSGSIYRKMGVVYFRGNFNFGGTSLSQNTYFAQLPAGFRPAVQWTLIGVEYNVHYARYIVVDTDGRIRFGNGASPTTYLQFSGSFPVT